MREFKHWLLVGAMLAALLAAAYGFSLVVWALIGPLSILLALAALPVVMVADMVFYFRGVRREEEAAARCPQPSGAVCSSPG